MIRLLHAIWAFLSRGYKAHCPMCHTVFFQHEGITHNILINNTFYRYVCKKCSPKDVLLEDKSKGN